MFQHLFQLFIQSLHKTESAILEPLNVLYTQLKLTTLTCSGVSLLWWGVIYKPFKWSFIPLLSVRHPQKKNWKFGVDFFSLTVLYTLPSIIQFDQATESSASSGWRPCFLLLIGQHTTKYCHSILKIAWHIAVQFSAISHLKGLLWALQEGAGIVLQLTRLLKCLSIST